MTYRVLSGLVVLTCVLMVAMPVGVALTGMAEPSWPNHLMASGSIRVIRWAAGAPPWIQAAAVGAGTAVALVAHQRRNDGKPAVERRWMP
jgi:hypothetical protein